VITSKVWWKSRTIWAIAVAAVVQILVAAGVLEQSAETNVVELVLLALGLLFRWQATEGVKLRA